MLYLMWQVPLSNRKKNLTKPSFWTAIRVTAILCWVLYTCVPGSVLNVSHVIHSLSMLSSMHTNLNIKYIPDFSRGNNANISTVGHLRLGISRTKFAPVFSLISCASKNIARCFPRPGKGEPLLGFSEHAGSWIISNSFMIPCTPPWCDSCVL